MKQDPQLQEALSAAIRPAAKLAKTRPGEVLAAISAFLPVVFEDLPPNRLETALRSVETWTADKLPPETLAARKAFADWVRAEMLDFRLHGFGETADF